MKKYNYILIMVMAFAMTLASCSQKEEIGSDIQGTAEVEINLSKAELLKSGALTSPSGAVDEIVYCDDELATAGTVTLIYNVDFDKGVDLEGEEVEFSYDSESTIVDEGISKLIQFDFPNGATFATITVTKAIISNYNKQEKGQDFVAPVKDSPFADYVENPVGKPWTVDLYGKTYIKVEVLCFNKQTVALFGYSWFDFEILTGDEVCCFFNCLGVTSETYHQVYAAKVDAYMFDDNGNRASDEAYWSGLNYDNDIYGDDYEDADIRAFCIPMPGNWKTYGVELVLTPLGSFGSPEETKTTISLTPAQIEAFLAETPVAEELIPDSDNDYYTLDLDIAGNAPFLHYTMKDCQKAQMYYSNNNGEDTDCEIFAVNVFEGVVYTQKIAEVEGYRGHIAITPDETTLIVADKDNPDILTLIDVYTMEQKEIYGLSGRHPRGDETMPEYDFVQLVYIDDQLYAGCQANECLVPINIDGDNFTFEGYLIDARSMAGDETFELGGADLIAAKATTGIPVHKGNVLYSFTNTGKERFIKYQADEDGDVYSRRFYMDLPDANMTGAAFNYKAEEHSAVTSHTKNGVVSFYLWDAKKDAAGKYYHELSYPEGVAPIAGKGGDMASSWNDDIKEGQMGPLFKFYSVKDPNIDPQ